MNITIGTAYLEGLANRYEQDWPKVFAAYNAGPGAVAKWIAFMPLAETDEFVEGIRYRETRIYVKKVLFNWALYHRIYAERSPDRKTRRCPTDRSVQNGRPSPACDPPRC